MPLNHAAGVVCRLVEPNVFSTLLFDCHYSYTGFKFLYNGSANLNQIICASSKAAFLAKRSYPLLF